jgi:biopolymer transport protein ExbB
MKGTLGRGIRSALLWAVVMLALALPQVASAWWNNDWQFRKRLSIDPALVSATAGAGVTEVAMPVRLHAGNFGYFSDVEKSGADLRFIAADDHTPLDFRIERIDTAAGIAIAWVKLPVADLGADHAYIWMYYGAPTAKAVSSRELDDPAVVASYDFAEASGPPRDGTAFASNATASTAQGGVAGVIDRALGFTAQSSVSLPQSPAFDFPPGKGMTLSGWIRLEPGSAPGLVYSQSGTDGGLELSVTANGLTALAGPAGHEARVSAPLTDGWHHLGVTLGEHLALYVDGKQAQSVTAPRMHLSSAPVLGAAASGASFTGALDSVRIAGIERPAGWFALQYQVQKPDSTLITYAQDESRSSGGMSQELGLISRLLGSVTIDGWIVISLIAVLGVLSGDVLVTKMRQLGRAEHGDRSFMSEFAARWGADAAQLAANGAPPAAQAAASPLQRMYARGLAELQLALGQSAERRRLPAEYLGVIRSALDVGIVEETDALNRRLVLMTIAVSGGPFLGLLGTVVGVMITFASIAATGDVNVNTIAPGVAAALFATVAGLLVAIPSLFGYNFVATRVGARVSAMDAFADQLVARFAATFSGTANLPEAAHAS